MLEKREFDTSDFLWRVSATVTVISGLFSVIIFALLLINYLQIQRLDPVNHELLTHMRIEYANAHEKDPALAQRIRDLDLMTRKAFFTSQTHLRVGAWTLLGSVVIFLVAMKNMIRWHNRPPELGELPTADKEFLAYAQSRQLLTWTAVGLLAGGMMTSYFSESALTAELLEAQNPTAAEEPAAAAVTFPASTWDEMAVNWPSFRGPGSNGVAHFATAPTEWDVEAGTNIRWAVEAPPLPGNNSPVIWGDRLFVAGADADTRAVYCFDVNDGTLLWTQTLPAFPGTPRDDVKPYHDTGYAACTMAAHGELVFAAFTNGDLACYDREGKLIWGKNLGLADNHYGHSSSLLAFENLLYVQYDQVEDAKLYAFDISTGKEAWVTPRERISWASPIIAQTALGFQLILSSEQKADGYDPYTGNLLWSEACLGGEVAPSPAYANGMVFVANEYAVASAISLGGTAEAVETEVVWQYDDRLPEVSSPVGDGERFYLGTAIGEFVCLDAQTGEVLWIAETNDGIYSSPIFVGDRIYVADMRGNMYIFKASDTLEELAVVSLGEAVHTTPAFLDGRIYIRTETQLYCIEAP